MKLKKQYEKLQKLYNQGYRFNAEEQKFYLTNKDWKQPQGYEEWEVEYIEKDAYLKERLKAYGIKDKSNKITLTPNDLADGGKYDSAIFLASKEGDIEILQYSLHRKPWEFIAKQTSAGTKVSENVQTRINPLWADCCEGKYDFSEATNKPFWHPEMIRLFEEKEEVPTLVITEGQFKAFKAVEENLPTVGLTSISHFRDGKLNTLHPEILEFINACKVSKVVILWDGDCRDISLKVLNQEFDNDISKRPGMFYGYACKIKELIYDFLPKSKVKVFFATIKSNDIAENPKGIDDLLLVKKLKAKDVLSDFHKIGGLPGNYLDWIDISTEEGVKRLRKYFHLKSVQAFYGFHQDKIKAKSFVFQGTSYKVEKGVPIVEIPKDLKAYKRIGTDYYRLIKRPLPKIGNYISLEHNYEDILAPWTLAAIKSDYGKDADKYVERFDGFTNIASHTNYQQVVDGFWNLYSDIDHKPQPGDFPNIKKLLKHIFEEQFDNEMIYDYFSLLYLQPWQKLPIIALTSRETATGKSTFVYLMKLIFKDNMYLASNQDLEGDFNSHWVSKLVVASEETLVEKKTAYETIKSMVTAKEVPRNEKNRSGGSIPCMLHFVMCSNNETDFLKIDKFDTRFWVRKVKEIPKSERDNNFDQKLEQEIPYFIDFITTREIKRKKEDRLYIKPEEFHTEAFKNLVYNSQSELLKDLQEEITDYFCRYPNEMQLAVSPVDLKERFNIASRYSNSYLSKILTNELKATQDLGEKGGRKLSRYYFMVTERDVVSNTDVERRINKVGRPFFIKKSNLEFLQ